MSLVQSNPNTPRKHHHDCSLRGATGRGVLSATSPHRINASNTATSPFHSVKLKPVPSPLKPKSITLHQPQSHLATSPVRKGTNLVPITSSPLKHTISLNTKTPPVKQNKQHTSTAEHIVPNFQQQRATLLSQYSAKQAQIKHYQQKLSHKQLQLLEIESQLQELNRTQLLQSSQQNNSQLDIYKQASFETERQLANNQLRVVDLDQTPNLLKSPIPLKHTLLKQTSYITSAIDECCTTMGKKASMIFNNSNSDGDENNIFVKPQFKSDKFDSLTRQTSQFFDNLLSAREKKMCSTDDEEEQNAHDSFDIDSLGVDLVYEQVDIDDYDSSFD